MRKIKQHDKEPEWKLESPYLFENDNKIAGLLVNQKNTRLLAITKCSFKFIEMKSNLVWISFAFSELLS